MTANPDRTSNGAPITDDLIRRAVAEAEAGYDPGQLTARPTGRPLIGSAPATGVPVRFPPELRHQLQQRAEAEQVTEAALVRRAVADYLDRSA